MAALAEVAAAPSAKKFHIFITDALLAERLNDKFESQTFKDDNTPIQIRCFLDKNDLVQGSAYESQFLDGLNGSCLFAPVMSERVLESFSTLKEGGTDNVLMEWELALDLYNDWKLHIIPLLVGTNPSGMYEKFKGWNASLPDVYTSHCKKRTVKETVQELLKIQGVFLNPEDLGPQVRDVIERFSEDVWPSYRSAWVDQDAIGREAEQLCVQCGKTYLESKNLDTSCRFHTVANMGKKDSNVKMGCCMKGADEPGCQSARHRPEHHNDYPYGSHMEWVYTCTKYNPIEVYHSLDITYPGTNPRDILETKVDIGRLMGDHAYSNQIFVTLWIGVHYLQVYSFDVVKKVGPGEEKVSEWKHKSGILTETLLGIRDGVYRLHVLWTPSDEEEQTCGAVLFDWREGLGIRHLASEEKPFEKVGFGKYVLPGVTRTGLRLPIPRGREAMRPRAWDRGLGVEMEVKRVENSVSEGGRDVMSVVMDLKNDGRGVDLRRLKVQAFYRLRGSNSSRHPVDIFWDEEGRPVDPFERRGFKSQLVRQSSVSEKPGSMTVSMEWDNIIDNALINQHTKDSTRWADLGGVTARAGPVLVDIVLVEPVTGRKSGVVVERCCTRQSDAAKAGKGPKFIGELTVDVGEIWRRERVVIEKGQGKDVIVIKSDGPYNQTHTYDVQQFRDAWQEALEQQNNVVLLTMVESPDEYNSSYTISALVDLQRRAVYALQVDMKSKDAAARGFFRVPDYGDCLWNGKDKEEKPGRGMQVMPVSGAVGVAGLEGGVEEEGELYVEQDETEFELRVDEVGEEFVKSDDHDGSSRDRMEHGRKISDVEALADVFGIGITSSHGVQSAVNFRESPSTTPVIASAPRIPPRSVTLATTPTAPPRSVTVAAMSPTTPPAAMSTTPPAAMQTISPSPAVDTTTIIAALRAEVSAVLEKVKSPPPPAPPVIDTTAIINSLRADLHSALSQQSAPVDTAAIVNSLRTEVRSILEDREPTPAPAPNLDTAAIVNSLRTEVRSIFDDREPAPSSASGLDTAAIVNSLRTEIRTALEEHAPASMPSPAVDTAAIVNSLRAEIHSALEDKLPGPAPPTSVDTESLVRAIRMELHSVMEEKDSAPSSAVELDTHSIVQSLSSELRQIVQQEMGSKSKPEAPALDAMIIRNIIRQENGTHAHSQSVDVKALQDVIRKEMMSRSTGPGADVEGIRSILREEMGRQQQIQQAPSADLNTIRALLREEMASPQRGAALDANTIRAIFREEMKSQPAASEAPPPPPPPLDYKALRSIIREEMTSLQAPPVLDPKLIRDIIRREVRLAMHEEPKSGAFDPDAFRSLIRTEIRATVHDEIDNMFDRLKNGKDHKADSLPRKPSMTSVASPTSVTNIHKWSPPPTSPVRSSSSSAAQQTAERVQSPPARSQTSAAQQSFERVQSSAAKTPTSATQPSYERVQSPPARTQTVPQHQPSYQPPTAQHMRGRSASAAPTPMLSNPPGSPFASPNIQSRPRAASTSQRAPTAQTLASQAQAQAMQMPSMRGVVYQTGMVTPPVSPGQTKYANQSSQSTTPNGGPVAPPRGDPRQYVHHQHHISDGSNGEQQMYTQSRPYGGQGYNAPAYPTHTPPPPGITYQQEQTFGGGHGERRVTMMPPADRIPQRRKSLGEGLKPGGGSFKSRVQNIMHQQKQSNA
ncbi:hypothetical protein HDV00_009720 [Rhizophlyctis rosea]|nr:hypothetical protein HDV00_009720 [Rhizophlyctis rosea]